MSPEIAKTYAATLSPWVPCIYVSSSNLLYINAGFCFLIFISALKNNRFFIKLDKMGLFLLFRIVLGAFQIFIFNFFQTARISFSNYLLYVMEFFLYEGIYCFCKNDIRQQVRAYTNIISFVTAVFVIIQAVTIVLPKIPYSNAYYKGCLNLPIGSSNFLATLIAPGLIASIYNPIRSKKKRKIIFYSSGTLGLFLTKSRFAIAIFIVALVIWLFLDKNGNKLVKILAFICACGVVSYFCYTSFDAIKTVLYGYSDYVTTGGFLNKITSGRLGGIEEYLPKIINNLIIGSGPNYESSRLHIILLDILYQNGILGLLIFFYSIIFILNKNKHSKQFSYVVVAIMVVNAMGEITFFLSLLSDIILFLNFATLSRIETYQYEE